MKRIRVILLAVLLCLPMAACGDPAAPEDHSQEIRVKITNTASKPLAGMGVTWYSSDTAFHTSGMKTASGEAIGNCEMIFTLNKEDIPEDMDLTQFGLEFSVTEMSGVSSDVCTVRFPAELGKEYVFELREENGCYAIWSESEGTLFSENSTAEETAKSIDLTGPWHLDNEKNDLDAFADLFPAYAEFGAGMELKSDGQMRWYIGAAGGCGTYIADDDLLHAALIADMDQKNMQMELRILSENEETILEMDYEGMTIYWVYGDQEDPAKGTDNE